MVITSGSVSVELPLDCLVSCAGVHPTLAPESSFKRRQRVPGSKIENCDLIHPRTLLTIAALLCKNAFPVDTFST